MEEYELITMLKEKIKIEAQRLKARLNFLIFLLDNIDDSDIILREIFNELKEIEEYVIKGETRDFGLYEKETPLNYLIKKLFRMKGEHV